MKALRISLMIIITLMIAHTAFSFAPTSLFAADSLRTKTIDGKKYLMHKVSAKENWTSIAKKYNIKIQDLMDANKGVSMLKTNQIIHIPVNESSSKVENNNPSTEKNANDKMTMQKDPKSESPSANGTHAPIFHNVKKGETLFSISKKYNADVDDIKKWNDLKGTNIGVGKKLIVGYDEKKTNATATNSQNDNASGEKSETGNNAGKTQQTNDVISTSANEEVKPTVEKKEYLKTTSSGKTVNQIVESGEACWVNDADLNPNKYYALHRTAPIGTIAKVINKMNGKSVYVKIIGRLPNTGDNFNMLIKLSKAAADKIGVIDEHFQAEISYAAVDTP